MMVEESMMVEELMMIQFDQIPRMMLKMKLLVR